MIFYSQDCVPFYLACETLHVSNVLHVLSVLDTSSPFWSDSLTRDASLAPGLAFSPFWFMLWQLSELKLCWIGLGLWKTLQVLKFQLFTVSVLPVPPWWSFCSWLSTESNPWASGCSPKSEGRESTTMEKSTWCYCIHFSQLALRFQNQFYSICSHSYEMSKGAKQFHDCIIWVNSEGPGWMYSHDLEIYAYQHKINNNNSNDK